MTQPEKNPLHPKPGALKGQSTKNDILTPVLMEARGGFSNPT